MPGLLLKIKMVIGDFIKTVSKAKGCLSNTDLISHTNEGAKNGQQKMTRETDFGARHGKTAWRVKGIQESHQR